MNTNPESKMPKNPLTPVMEPLVDCEGTVKEMIPPGKKGRVLFQGTDWPAICIEKICLEEGVEVCVIGRCNITLWVKPLQPA